jgi:hypothetical protein
LEDSIPVGAVYDRPLFPAVNEIRAVIDRPYSAEGDNLMNKTIVAAAVVLLTGATVCLARSKGIK